jgi:hypothetical protein
VPSREQLSIWMAARGLELDETLGALAARDLVHCDPDSGAVAVAYPFCGRATAHRVRLAAGVQVFAMCAIDALGIAFMLNQAVEVSSSDPTTGEAITVTVRVDGDSEWSPTDTAVVLACSAGATSALCACPHTNFAASVQSARRLLDAMPTRGECVLSMPDAIMLGRDVFGAVLHASGDPASPRPDRGLASAR